MDKEDPELSTCLKVFLGSPGDFRPDNINRGAE